MEESFCIFDRVGFLNAYILLSFVKTSLSVHEGSYLSQENCPNECFDLCVFL